MAGFQVSINGRIWVSTEGFRLGLVPAPDRAVAPGRQSGVERGSTPAKGVAYGRSTSGAQLPRLSRGRRLGWGLLRWPGADGATAPGRSGSSGARSRTAGRGFQPLTTVGVEGCCRPNPGPAPRRPSPAPWRVRPSAVITADISRPRSAARHDWPPARRRRRLTISTPSASAAARIMSASGTAPAVSRGAPAGPADAGPAIGRRSSPPDVSHRDHSTRYTRSEYCSSLTRSGAPGPAAPHRSAPYPDRRTSAQSGGS